MKLRLASRRSPDARCAFCHDALEGVIATCPRCLTPFHRDCRGHLGQCPTLGCNTTFSAAPEVDIERDAPASLASELLRERAQLVVLPAVATAVVVWLLVRETPQPVGAAVIAALVLPWLAWNVGRELGFFVGLGALLATEPSTMQLEVRVEPHHEDRFYVARLTGADGRILEISSPPDWLIAQRPGTTVQVHGREGCVAIRTQDGHVYAAPARRIKQLA